MNFLQPASNISRQWHPCPRCNASTAVDVITKIGSDEDLTNYCQHRLNRAPCSFCGALVEAPVRLRVELDCEFIPDHECVPLALLENPEVLDDLIHNNPPGLHRVYSNDELERSIEAFFRMECRRRKLTPEQAAAGYFT